ncbi:MAG: hypothetical protein ABI853_09050, partial [Sphingomicrobium sp.]
MARFGGFPDPPALTNGRSDVFERALLATALGETMTKSRFLAATAFVLAAAPLAAAPTFSTQRLSQHVQTLGS